MVFILSMPVSYRIILLVYTHLFQSPFLLFLELCLFSSLLFTPFPLFPLFPPLPFPFSLSPLPTIFNNPLIRHFNPLTSVLCYLLSCSPPGCLLLLFPTPPSQVPLMFPYSYYFFFPIFKAHSVNISTS